MTTSFKTAKAGKAVMMDADSWYLEKFKLHECCDCGLTHDVEYKVESGKLLTKWSRNDKETAISRKENGYVVYAKGKKAAKA